MELNQQEKELLLMMISKYKKGLVRAYKNNVPLLGNAHPVILAELLAELDEYTSGTRPLEKLHLGILESIQEVLGQFDIIDPDSVMVQVRNKIRIITNNLKRVN